MSSGMGNETRKRQELVCYYCGHITPVVHYKSRRYGDLLHGPSVTGRCARCSSLMVAPRG